MAVVFLYLCGVFTFTTINVAQTSSTDLSVRFLKHYDFAKDKNNNYWGEKNSLVVAQVSVCAGNIFVNDSYGFPQLIQVKRDTLKQYL